MPPSSLFVKILGNRAKVKVLDFLMKSPKTDFSISAIAKGAGIGRTTLFRIWKSFEDMRLVRKTRIIGNAKLFTLNIQNPMIEKMSAFYEQTYYSMMNDSSESEKPTKKK